MQGGTKAGNFKENMEDGRSKFATRISAGL